MDLVVDANILFAALIKENITSDLLFKNDLHLYTSEFIFEEFGKYKELIKNKTGRTDEEFEEFFNSLQRRITIIPSEEIELFLKKAKEISPDIKDVPYVAVALKLNIAIWSNDRKLKEKQNVVRVYSTEELMDMTM